MFVTDLGVYGLPGDVVPWDLRFDPGDRAHLERTVDGRILMRVRTEPGFEDGMCVVRAASGAVTGHPLEPLDGHRFRFWQADLDPFDGPVDFSFAFRSPSGHPVYLVPSGVSAAVERLDRWHLEPGEPAPVDVPGWAQGAVVYQIFPDRFAKGDPSTDPSDVAPWGSTPHGRRFMAGDLAGIEGRLDHLEWLGIELLYLNPIFASPSNHRYDTTDYFRVDPMLGGNDALRSLVDAVHRRDMRIILDASFNHVHPSFFAFADVVEHGPDSRYADWFRVTEWPLRIRYRPEARDADRVRDWLDTWRNQCGIPVEEVAGDGLPAEPTYEAWFGVPTMPRLDLSRPAPRAHVLEVARHWVAEYDIDGWRMDVARYVDPDFWNDFRTTVKEAKADAYLLAEVMGDTGDWLQGDRFDATMNYTFRDLALAYLARDELDGGGFLDHATRLVFQYAWPVTLANQNLIGSHDTPRFLSIAGGEVWRLRLATVLQMTFPGAPGIYYGDEVGLEGGHDPGSRGAFPWHEDPASHTVARTVSELAALRRRRRALRTGGWRPRHASGGLAVFERGTGRDRAVVAINRGRRRAGFPHDGGSVRWGSAEIEDGTVFVGGRDAAVIW